MSLFATEDAKAPVNIEAIRKARRKVKESGTCPLIMQIPVHSK
jgi:hypothetical protein